MTLRRRLAFAVLALGASVALAAVAALAAAQLRASEPRALTVASGRAAESAASPSLPATAPALRAGEPIQPIPPQARQDPLRVELGRRLFHDARFSPDGKVSCASCHELTRGGADGRPRSVGVNGQVAARNAPTVYNAALNFRQFWDGRADSLEAQAEQVFENPVEMGGNWPDILHKLRGDTEYARIFAAAYRTGITRENVVNAIATFERTLVTPDARFDRYLRGEDSALSALETAGYVKFKQFGCAACHQGVNAGGNMYQRYGAMDGVLKRPPLPPEADPGRFAITRSDADRQVFKVPGLRNVELTAPYFHDGSAATLEVAVEVMFHHQLGRVASKEDKAAIVAFLRSLTGEMAQPSMDGR